VEAYRARQTLVYEPSGAVSPNGPATAFETGVILSGNTDYTTLLKNGENAAAASDLALSRLD